MAEQKKRNRTRKKKEQLHDAVFKTFFSDVTIVKNYLVHYTPKAIHEGIDFAGLRKSDTAFISGRFGVSFSDVDYLLQIWEDDVKNRRPFSFIIPVVVYHGKQKWKQKSFSDYFRGLPKGWEAFIPNFKYLLTDLREMPQEDIQEKKDSEHLQNLFLALKFSGDKETALKNLKKILTFGGAFKEDDRERILFQTLTLYMIKVLKMPQTEIKSLSNELPEPENSWVDAIPEIFGEQWKKAGLREGRKLGRAQGREEGRVEGREEGREEALRLLTIKIIQKFPDWSDAEVAEFVGVTTDDVQQLRVEISKKTVGI